MAVRTNGNGQLATTTPATPTAPEKRKPPETLGELVRAMKGHIEQVVPKHITPERMTQIALSAIRTTKDLDKCTLPSFGAAVMACSVLGLEPNTPLGQAYLIPYKNSRRNTLECQLIIGYQGMLDLIRRSGAVASIQAFAVYEGDTFKYELGLNPTLKHKPSEAQDREDKRLTHAYCVVRLKDKDADPIFKVMSRSQIEKHRKRGASGRTNRYGEKVSTPWDTDYEAMALKTVVRAISKWVPRSTDNCIMATGVAVDERQESGGSILPLLPESAQEPVLPLLTAGDELDDEQEPENDPVSEEPPNTDQPIIGANFQEYR